MTDFGTVAKTAEGAGEYSKVKSASKMMNFALNMMNFGF